MGLLLTCMCPWSSVAQDKPVYDVGILVDVTSQETRSLITQLQREITAVVGEDAEVRFPPQSVRANEFDQATAEAHYEALLQGSTDIILAFGPVNSQVITAQEIHEKPTILFGAVDRDVIQLDDTRATSGIDNFTYLVAQQSYREDLQAFHDLYAFERVAVVVAGPPRLARRLEAPIDAIVSRLGAEHALIPYTTLDDLRSRLSSFDALYMAEGFGIPAAERRTLADDLIELGMPSFTATRQEDVLAGWMATNRSKEGVEQFFRRIALSVEAVVNGENLASLPVSIDTSDELTLNFNTADRVGVPLRYSALSRINLVGDFGDMSAGRTYTLVDVIDEVLASNLSLAANRQNVDLARQDVRTARSTFLPTVTASATGSHLDPAVARVSNGQNPEYATSGSLTLTQTLYSDAALLNIRIQQALREAEIQNVEVDVLDLILDATNAYFNVLVQKANLRIRKQNLEVTKRNLQVAEQNFEAGQSGQSDVLRFRSQQAQNTQALIEAINQLKGSIQVLNLLLNTPIDRRINLADVSISDGVFESYNYEQLRDRLDDPNQREVFEAFLVEEALRNAPELRALDFNREAVQRSIRLNGPRRFLPTIAAQAQYNRTFEQWGDGVPPPSLALDDNYSVGVSLSIPLFDGNRFNLNRQIATIQAHQLALNRAGTEQALERTVRASVLDLINEIANIELSQVSEDAAAQSLALTETLYATGAVTVVQLIDAQSNLLQAQLASANATYTFLLAATALERSIGYYFLRNSPEDNDAFLQRFSTFQARRATER